MNYDVECPYCSHLQDICHDDGYGYEEGKRHNQECGKCGKTFVFETEISISHEVFKADCLNGSDHNWQPTKTFPKEYTKMMCSDCGERREPTSQEKELYNIPPHK
jgi:hypothetical protein